LADPEDPNDTVDLVLRHVTQRFPDDLARALLGPGLPITAVPYETQLDARHRRLDRALDVHVRGDRRLLHVEWQSDMPPDLPLRVYEYNVMLSLAAAAEAAEKKQPIPPIDSVVVLLGGRERPWPSHGFHRTSSRDERFSGVRYRIEPVYQRTVAELEARGSPLWLAFAPLAADADPDKVVRVVEALRERTSPAAFEEIGVAMAVLAGADGRKRGLEDVVRSRLPRELVMRSWIYQEGREEGLEAGVRPTVHQFERRLARELTATERATLLERLRKEGAERLGDVVLDLSPEDLAAWLAAG
jgi:hypothetical protein